MRPDEVRTRVEEALARFAAADLYLLTHDLNERCIAGRLAFHLQNVFADYTVDIEYNRAGESPKRLMIPEECANFVNAHGQTLVIPDIIIHRRGADGPNLLGIELKKAGNQHGVDCDRVRIEALKKQLRYVSGALIECETRPGWEPRIVVLEWL